MAGLGVVVSGRVQCLPSAWAPEWLRADLVGRSWVRGGWPPARSRAIRDRPPVRKPGNLSRSCSGGSIVRLWTVTCPGPALGGAFRTGSWVVAAPWPGGGAAGSVADRCSGEAGATFGQKVAAISAKSFETTSSWRPGRV